MSELYGVGLKRLKEDMSFEYLMDSLRQLNTISQDIYNTEKLQLKLKYNKRKVISANKFSKYNIDDDNSSD